MFSKLDLKLINSYTVLLMAEEITLEEVPETVLTNGNTLRYEVELEEARRITNIIPKPIDNNVIARIEATEMAVAGLMAMMLMPEMPEVPIEGGEE